MPVGPARQAAPQFYLTMSAVEQFARLEGLDPDVDRDFDAAEDRLLKRAPSARFVRAQRNGLQLWQLGYEKPNVSKGKRYRFLVSTRPQPGGDLPQVVEVLPETAGPRK